MEGKKTAGIVSLVVGILILVGSLAADLIYSRAGSGFGYAQIGGTLVGVLVILIALILTFRK